MKTKKNIISMMTMKQKRMGLPGDARLCDMILGQGFSIPTIATNPIDTAKLPKSSLIQLHQWSSWMIWMSLWFPLLRDVWEPLAAELWSQSMEVLGPRMVYSGHLPKKIQQTYLSNMYIYICISHVNQMYVHIKSIYLSIYLSICLSVYLST